MLKYAPQRKGNFAMKTESKRTQDKIMDITANLHSLIKSIKESDIDDFDKHALMLILLQASKKLFDSFIEQPYIPTELVFTMNKWHIRQNAIYSSFGITLTNIDIVDENDYSDEDIFKRPRIAQRNDLDYSDRDAFKSDSIEKTAYMVVSVPSELFLNPEKRM